MDRRFLLGGGVVLGLVVLALAWRAPSGAPEGEASEEGAVAVAEAPAPALTPAEQKRLELREKHAADGEVDHPHRSAIPPMQEEPDPLGREVSSGKPYGDGERWRNKHEEQARRIHDEQLAAAEEWVGSAGLEPTEANQVIGVVDRLHEELTELRLQVESGELQPPRFREEVARLRTETADELNGVLDASEVESLRLALADASVGGGF